MANIYKASLPPRRVPFLVRYCVMFGGWRSGVFWPFFIIGIILYIGYGSISPFIFIYSLLDDLLTANATVTSVKKIGVFENDSESSTGKQFYAYHYAFKTPEGKEYYGISYGEAGQLGEGQKATIEYAQPKPFISRIKGMRSDVDDFPRVFLIFPGIGLLIMLSGLPKGFRAMRLLKYGKVALGKLKSKRLTGWRINKKPLYKLVFEFVTETGEEHEIVTKTLSTDLLEDDAQEKLLYDPLGPTTAVMLDSLPGSPEFSEMGNIRIGSITRTLAVIIWPIGIIIGLVAFIYMLFFQ